MSRSSAKAAKGSQKTATRAVKKPAKAAKTARAADKKAAKSARSPVGKAPTVAKVATGKTVAIGKAAPVSKMAETARALMGAARASKAAAAAKAAARTEVAPAKETAANMIRTVSPPVQPAAPEIVIKSHKYQVGEAVYFTSPSFGRAAASGSYTVVKLLPSDTDDYQYRIKSSGEAFERVAKESQLEKM